MALEKAKHFVYLPGVLNAKIEVILPDIYGAIGDVVGVFKPTVLYSPALRLSANELRRNGVVAKVQVRTETGKSFSVLCSVEKLSSALPGLVGKSIPEQIGSEVVFKKITKVSIPRRRTRL